MAVPSAEVVLIIGILLVGHVVQTRRVGESHRSGRRPAHLDTTHWTLPRLGPAGTQSGTDQVARRRPVPVGGAHARTRRGDAALPAGALQRVGGRAPTPTPSAGRGRPSTSSRRPGAGERTGCPTCSRRSPTQKRTARREDKTDEASPASTRISTA